MRALKTIAVFTGTRAEYGLLHPVIGALHEAPDFSLRLIASGSHLDSRYGDTLAEIEADGFPVALTLPLPQLGEAMAIDCGTITQQLGAYFSQPESKPDALVVLGDRYETLGAVTAALLSNVVVAHLHGGDITGGGVIDDAIRHAITKMAHLHFPATAASADRIRRLGESAWRIHLAGSPVLDTLRQLPTRSKDFFVDTYGWDPHKPWILFTQHPLTTQPEAAGAQMRDSLDALLALGQGVELIATYPNHDAGSAAMIAVLEIAAADAPHLHVVKTLGRVNYLNLLRHVLCVAGNSSSGLLETAHFGVPCLNIGQRQSGRERGGNVVDVPQEKPAIEATLRRVLDDAAFRRSLQTAPHPFGQGECAQTVLSVMRNAPPVAHLLQKQHDG